MHYLVENPVALLQLEMDKREAEVALQKGQAISSELHIKSTTT
jgi:hypothetical protein